MKIIQIIPQLGLGGAEIMCENLTYALQRLGHEVSVISTGNDQTVIAQRMKDQGIQMFFLNKKSGIDFSVISQMRKIFKEQKPDVIHTHLHVLQYVMPAIRGLAIRGKFHTIHNVAQEENVFVLRLLNKQFFKHDHVKPIALSDLIRDSIVEEYHIQKEKIPVIFNGIDLSKCLPKEAYFTNGNFKILHIGRFDEQKNHIGLLNAFHAFHEKHPDSELWLIGDGEKRAEMEIYVNENRLADSVKFLGLQSSVYGYLRDADMFTLPSLYEGIPMTLIEAMGTGLPIVATKVGGVLDMLDENSALLVDVDVEQVAQAFERYYLDEQLRKKHGTAAKERVIQFSAEQMAKDYECVYHLNNM